MHAVIASWKRLSQRSFIEPGLFFGQSSRRLLDNVAMLIVFAFRFSLFVFRFSFFRWIWMNPVWIYIFVSIPWLRPRLLQPSTLLLLRCHLMHCFCCRLTPGENRLHLRRLRYRLHLRRLRYRRQLRLSLSRSFFDSESRNKFCIVDNYNALISWKHKNKLKKKLSNFRQFRDNFLLKLIDNTHFSAFDHLKIHLNNICLVFMLCHEIV